MTEAILMWIIEACSVVFEVLIFRIQYRSYHQRYDMLDQVQKHLTLAKADRATSLRAQKTTSHSSRASSQISDDDSASQFFNGELNDVEQQADASGMRRGSFLRSNSYSSASVSLDPKIRESRLLRERRLLRLKQKEDRTKLKYHITGVFINVFFVGISFIMIVVIAASGGMCVRSGVRPVVFSMIQLEICSDCPGNIVNGQCEICDAEEVGDYQCYYQYLK